MDAAHPLLGEEFRPIRCHFDGGCLLGGVGVHKPIVRELAGTAGGYQLHDRAAILTKLSFEDFGVFEPRSLG